MRQVCVLWGAIGLLIVPPGLRAQTPAAVLAASTRPSPSPSPNKQMFGYVRFWNMLPGKPSEQLQLLSGEDKPLTASPFGNFYAGYLPVAPNTYTFIVRRPDAPSTPLKRLPVLMRGETFITILVTEKNGQPNVQLVDDTPDPKAPDGPCHLTLRDFFPKATVTVAVGTRPPTAPLAEGEFQTINNLPAVLTSLNMLASGLSPAPRMWGTEADFKATQHATLLIVPDAYGRFRPRLVYDGIKPEAAPAVPADRKP